MHGFAGVRAIIHSLKLVGYISVHTHKPYNNFYVFYESPVGLYQNNNEPQHRISNNVVYATSKASVQSAHTCTGSLIRAFASLLNIL